MDADRQIELDVSGDMETAGSPLIRELNEVFIRHGFDGGFLFSAFALDGERWRFDSGVVFDDTKVASCEVGHVVNEALEMVVLSAQDVVGGDSDE